MKSRVSLALALALALVPGVLASQETNSAGQARNASQPRPATPEPVATSNIQIELSVSDYVGSSAPQKKTVSMIIADGHSGRVRSQRGDVFLNVDARTSVTKDGRIWLQMTVQYRPRETADNLQGMTPIDEVVTVLLQSGKPLIVTQAADPMSDRKVAVEVTATVLK